MNPGIPPEENLYPLLETCSRIEKDRRQTTLRGSRVAAHCGRRSRTPSNDFLARTRSLPVAGVDAEAQRA